MRVKQSWPRAIGRYVLCDPIASGGMATVHLGRLLGQAGFSRVVAVKRLHDFLAIDAGFLEMFLEEARLAARIRHPNVVPTVDVVTIDDEAFLVMEYVSGETLSFFCRMLRDEGEQIPSDIVSNIVLGALHGLHAAHEAKSEKGVPLHLVHRDVSPQNILVGADGVARVMDFGVAKAAGRLQNTREGQIKGKIAYMAPEQVTGEGVTPASDVFSTSVVLWEALTSQRLFAAPNDVAAMHAILEGKIDPPSKLVEGISARLDEVVLRGLARDPAARYATALDMANDLEDAAPPATRNKVARWVNTKARESLAAKAALVERIESEPSFDALLAQVPSSSPMTAARAVGDEVPTAVSSGAISIRPAVPTDTPTSHHAAALARPPRSPARRAAPVALGALLVAGVVGLALRATPRDAGRSVASVASALPVRDLTGVSSGNSEVPAAPTIE
jgi:eukaryotic-like serine/threonine-protein kinase